MRKKENETSLYSWYIDAHRDIFMIDWKEKKKNANDKIEWLKWSNIAGEQPSLLKLLLTLM
jgi:hypothetical protein